MFNFSNRHRLISFFTVNNLCWLSGLLFFFLMLFVPYSYKFFRMLFLALIISFSIIKAVKDKTVWHPVIILWFLLFILHGVFFTLIGYDNIGAIRTMTVSFVWPVLFFLFIGVIDSENKILNIFNVMYITGIIISLYTLYYFGCFFGLFPSSFLLALDMGHSIGIHNGFFEYRLYNISTLVALTPFMVGLLFVSKNRFTADKSKIKIILYILFVLMPLVILSGRRGLWVITACAPFIGLFWSHFKYGYSVIRPFTRGLSVLSISLLLFFTFLTFCSSTITFDGFLSEVTSIIDFNKNASNSWKLTQAKLMFDGFVDKPLFGYGIGAEFPNGLRSSSQQPWASELVYNKLLYDTGIFGISSYFLLVFCVFYGAYIVITKSNKYSDYMIATITMFSCFMLANASNPYINMFDYIWVIFLPICIINRYFIEKR